MQAKDIMSKKLACCTEETLLLHVAQQMVACDCGAIPVVQDKGSMRPIGILTDRDITVRIVAEGKNPLEQTAADCMSTHLVTVPAGASMEECMDAMRCNQVRRVIVVDERGACVGIVAQADVANAATGPATAELLKALSTPVTTGAAPAPAMSEQFVG